ncbi:MAG: hypothetical protein HYX69_18615 [Planctomycetia bacterium]|nr:hypothetical protein [Planctomycetia bacterium]
MTTEQLKTALNQRPFRPFTLHLADGRGIAVQHNEFAMLSPSGRTVVVYQADDTMNIVDLLLVTDLEMAANGKRRKR